jgi:ubiquinone/menaquinone biosynthesis C-methylase UbiE
LDVGCGSGKQCFSFFHHLQGNVQITGTDVSESLLTDAREKNKAIDDAVDFRFLDFNQRFDLPENHYDLISACFAIYYAQDIPFTLSEMHRLLVPGGRLFTTGPMPSNKQLFYDIIKEATGKPIPPMPGSSRYASEIFGTMQALFSKTEQHIFENPLTFDSVEPFMVYTRASMSEDRKLWNSLFQTHDEFENVMAAIEKTAQRYLERDGKLVMTKVVGGFIATK